MNEKIEYNVNLTKAWPRPAIISRNRRNFDFFHEKYFSTELHFRIKLVSKRYYGINENYVQKDEG